MTLDAYLPFWKHLSAEQKQRLLETAVLREMPKGTMLHSGAGDCLGLLVVQSGMLRAYLLSDEGREITLYRLFPYDICLLSASCMMSSLEQDVLIASAEPVVFWQIPTDVYRQLETESPEVARYTNELMASRFSDVLWLLEQVLTRRLDARIAGFLLEEADRTGSDRLTMTHEAIARHLGSAREAVTRMLQYLQGEGMLTLFRGGMALINRPALAVLAGDSRR